MKHRTLILASLLFAGTLALTTMASAQYGPGVRRPDIRHQELSRTQIRGTVESIDSHGARIITENGEQYGVALGPQSYWRPRAGRYLQPGCEVTVDAWGDPYGRSDWYFAGSIWGDGFSVSFTNDYGVPYWEDYNYSDNWWPTYDLYAGWYCCRPVVYDYYLPPPPPVRYYSYYPRGYYPMRYRHFYRGYDFGRHDNGWHRGWDRGGHDRGWDRGGHDHGDFRDHERDGRRDDGRQGSGDYRGGPRGDSRQSPTPPRNPSYRGGPRGR